MALEKRYWVRTYVDATGADTDPATHREIVYRIMSANSDAYQALYEDGSTKSEVDWSTAQADVEAISTGYPTIRIVVVEYTEKIATSKKLTMVNGSTTTELASANSSLVTATDTFNKYRSVYSRRANFKKLYP